MPGSIAGHGGGFLARLPTAALKHHDQKEPEKERIYLACTSIITVHRGKKSRTGTDAETPEECCILDHSACFVTELRTTSPGWNHPL